MIEMGVFASEDDVKQPVIRFQCATCFRTNDVEKNNLDPEERAMIEKRNAGHFAKALWIRKSWVTCPECNAQMSEGIEHTLTCSFHQIEELANREVKRGQVLQETLG